MEKASEVGGRGTTRLRFFERRKRGERHLIGRAERKTMKQTGRQMSVGRRVGKWEDRKRGRERQTKTGMWELFSTCLLDCDGGL